MAAVTKPQTDVIACPVQLLTRGDLPHSDRAIRTGELIAVARGVYAFAAEWRALAPWRRYLARVHAASLRYPDAVFTHESAAALRGLPIFLEPPEVHVAHTPTRTSREYSGVRVHTAERMPAYDVVGGLLVATPIEAATDIARSRHNAIGLAVAGSAMRLDASVTREALQELNASRASSRGRRHARWVIERATDLPESPLEFVSLAAIDWLGMPTPELQQWIWAPDGTEGDRVDFRWPVSATGGEADGLLKYDGTNEHALGALQQRNRRDARLMSRGLSAVAHWGWSDVRAAGRPLRALLISAGVQPERPEDLVQLRSLQRALTPTTAKRQ